MAIRDDKLLPLAQRQFLWDVEHLAFVFEEQVFRPLSGAFSQGKWDEWKKVCASDFECRWPTSLWTEEFRTDAMTVQRGEFMGDEPADQMRTVSSAGFLAGLQAFRDYLDEPAKACSVGMGLVRFGPEDRQRLDGSWRSTWRIRLAGQRGERPVEIVMQLTLRLDAPSEDMGRRREWLRSAALDSIQLTESSRPLMREITADCGIDVSRMHDNWETKVFKKNTGGVYLCDFNDDGLDDVLVLNEASGANLYRGSGGGKFVDVTKDAGLPVGPPDLFSGAACWADFDGDADEDLILFHQLWENIGNGKFRDVTKKSSLLLGPAAGYAVADFDRDGQVDVYVCHSDQYMLGQRRAERVAWIDGGSGIDNVLWRNQGNWQFEDVTWPTKSGGGGLSCFAAVWFDANRDFKPDLLAINEFGRNALLIQQPHGEFASGDVDPVFGGLTMGVTAGDIDNDGLTDLYLANMYSKAGNRIFDNVDPTGYPPELLAKVRDSTTGSKLYRNTGDGTFEVVTGSPDLAQVGWAYGTNMADFDGDGLLDIYATAGFKSLQKGKPDG